MDDWSFNIPKKILRGLLIGAVIIAAIWGVITRDSKKGVDLYLKEVEIITKPIVNKMLDRINRFSNQ